MAAKDLVETIDSLTPEQQEAVRRFVAFLKEKSGAVSPFVSAADEFIDQHPELLRRLAQ